MKYREIAARIAAEAPKYPSEADAPKYPTGADWRGPRTTFRFGTLRIHCLAYQEAILRVAEKYRKGLHAKSTSHKARMPTLHRPKDADARLAELLAECGEDAQALRGWVRARQEAAWATNCGIAA